MSDGRNLDPIERCSARVSGEIVIPDPSALSESSILHVRLLDCSLADAAAQLVNSLDIRLDPRSLSRNVSFELLAEQIDAAADYTLEVHLDVDGDGRVNKGDFITTDSYPVITYGRPSQVQVRLERV